LSSQVSEGHQQELSQDPSQLEHFPTVAGQGIHAPVEFQT